MRAGVFEGPSILHTSVKISVLLLRLATCHKSHCDKGVRQLRQSHPEVVAQILLVPPFKESERLQ
jgi:hypothetical protein